MRIRMWKCGNVKIEIYKRDQITNAALPVVPAKIRLTINVR